MKPNEIYDLIQNTSSIKTGWDVDYAIVKEDKCVILIFRGSNSELDWQIDFNFPVKLYKQQCHKFLVHRGFGEAWKTANDEIMAKFIEECDITPDYKPLIVGHSLGGALAILAAEDFYFRTGKKADVVTFGCPRPLFMSFSREHFIESIGEINQYENVNDVVPKLPEFYSNINPVTVDEKKSLLVRLVNVKSFHLSYGNKELYKD